MTYQQQRSLLNRLCHQKRIADGVWQSRLWIDKRSIGPGLKRAEGCIPVALNQRILIVMVDP